MESQLLHVMLHNRERFFRVYPLLELRLYSKEFKHLAKLIGEYYQRDVTSKSVDPQVLIELITSTSNNDKHIAVFVQMMQEAAGMEVSDANVESTVISAKRRELEQKIALACVNQDDDVQELMESYRKLRSVATLDELMSEGATIIERVDVASLVTERATEGSLVKIFPLAVNERLDGGLLPGHHMTVFARPEMGKSQFVINAGAGVLRQNLRVLHIENEDRPGDVQSRYVSNLSGMDRHAVMSDPERAQRVADSYGLELLTVAELTPGTPSQVEELAIKYRANIVIVNQMRNLATGMDNRVLALEEAAMQCRNVAKRANTIVLSVTQAGDSASNKKFLEMGDVDFSNTGIPAACDVLLGIGADESMMRMQERGISFPKNKVGVGEYSHQGVVVRVRSDISRVLTAGMNTSQRTD